MSIFTDQMLLQLSDPNAAAGLLAPAPAPPPARLKTIIDAVYELPYTRIDSIEAVTVSGVQVQRPLFPVQRYVGTYTGAVPGYTRSDIAIDRTSVAEPLWVDLLLGVVLRVVAEVDPGGVESILTHEIADFSTLDEFRARFRFIDLDAFMQRHGITTVDELRDAYNYLLTEVRLRTPTVFDPADPANRHDIEVTLAVLVRDVLDVAASLRDAKLIRALAGDVVCARPARTPGETTAPYAMGVIFPQSTLVPGGPTEAAVHQLFAREGVLSLFADPV